jgi:hypothetical protein
LGLLNTIRRQADPAVAEEAAERPPAREHVVHRLADLGVAGHAGALPAHPALELGDERGDLPLPNGEALIGGQAVDGALGGEDRVDLPHRLGGERGAGHFGQLEQLAPAMGPTRCLRDRPWFACGRVELAEPGIGIGLQDALIARQVPLRVFPGPVAGVAEHGRRRRRPREGSIVAHIGPEPPRDRPAAGEHRHCGVIAVQAFGGEHMGVDQRHQRRERGGAGADPVGDGRDAELDALSGVGLALAVQRQVLAELRLEGHGQQVRPGPAAGDRMERRRRLGDRLAGAAGEPLAYGLDHLPLPRHHLQGLGDVLAQLGEPATAAGAGGGCGDHDTFPRQMLR